MHILLLDFCIIPLFASVQDHSSRYNRRNLT